MWKNRAKRKYPRERYRKAGLGLIRNVSNLTFATRIRTDPFVDSHIVSGQGVMHIESETSPDDFIKKTIKRTKPYIII